MQARREWPEALDAEAAISAITAEEEGARCRVFTVQWSKLLKELSLSCNGVPHDKELYHRFWKLICLQEGCLLIKNGDSTGPTIGAEECDADSVKLDYTGVVIRALLYRDFDRDQWQHVSVVIPYRWGL